MWEIVACPVIDVQAFLLDPLSCSFGIPDNGDGSAGIVSTFFESLNGDAIINAMKNATIPLAVEFVYNFSGLKFVENVSEEYIMNSSPYAVCLTLLSFASFRC